MIPKINQDQYVQFIEDFYNGKHQHQRLGQAFCNIHRISGDVEIDNLYYVENDEQALDIIEAHYLMKEAA